MKGWWYASNAYMQAWYEQQIGRPVVVGAAWASLVKESEREHEQRT